MLSEIDFDLIAGFFAAMLAIVNPVGKVPVWLECARGQSKAAHWRLALLVTGTATATLLLALWFGGDVLEAFSVDLASFQIGGGIIILTTGMAMLHGTATDVEVDEGGDDENPMEEAAQRFRAVVVPMAIPIIAGPGSITTAIVYANRANATEDRIGMTLVLLVVGVLILLSLWVAPWVRRVVGSIGLTVVTRLFGLLLVAIAMQLIVSGLGEMFPAWLEASSPLNEG